MKPIIATFSILIWILSLILGLYYRRQDISSPPFDKDVRLGSGKFFDSIANNYDTLNRVISLGLDNHWRREAVRALGIAPGIEARILDVATGTGDVAIVAAKLLGEKVVIQGLDPSQEMVMRGRKKVKELGLEKRIRLELGSVEELSERWGNGDGQLFDGATVAFGVRNFGDKTTGLKEMGKIVKREGRVVVLEVATSDEKGFGMTAARIFAKYIMPIMAGITGGKVEAYRYLASSMSKFPNSTEFSKLVGNAGLEIESFRRLPPFGVGPVLYVLKRPTR